MHTWRTTDPSTWNLIEQLIRDRSSASGGTTYLVWIYLSGRKVNETLLLVWGEEWRGIREQTEWTGRQNGQTGMRPIGRVEHCELFYTSAKQFACEWQPHIGRWASRGASDVPGS